MIMNLPLFAQRVLYKSNDFTITSDKVIQGKYEAFAKSRDEISSSYKSDFKVFTPDVITFKFSINGIDNERMPGQDHHLLIKSGNGKCISPLYVFGETNKSDTANFKKSGKLKKNTDLLIRLDMRHVLNDMNTKGYFQTYNGEKIYKKDFKGVYIAGSTSPLTWDFSSLMNEPKFKLIDKNGDGIYELNIHFDKVQYPGARKHKWLSWKLSKDISSYPSYHSPDKLIDALYNHSLEEMLLNIRHDGAFMAGAKWTGVWTRDISYSIFLSLAMVNPDAAKTSLMAKVKNDRIIQDTGTGGAWPVSSDRLVWSLAAWEVYLSTGDKDWLKESYNIIKNSVDDDLNTVFDESTGLFSGESSFLDWREQTYPRWMDPKDIYSSKNLGTNAVHYQALKILANMAKILGEPSEKYSIVAGKVKAGMNKLLWLKNNGYYGQYLYGRNYYSLSPKSEALGEALSVLSGVAGNERGADVIKNTPVTSYGVTCIYPQIPNIPPYHNNAVWPFVESYWAWASAKTGNAKSVESALASVYRAAALFVTNKENMVASTGDYLGTEINSDRQLWSVAGNLALIYRVIFGITLNPNSLSFNPFIPEAYKGERTLNGFKYRNSVLSISVKGYGDKIESMTLDGKKITKFEIPAELNGNHDIIILMNNKMTSGSSINSAKDSFAPETPAVKVTDHILIWKSINNAVKYVIYRNGKKVAQIKYNSFKVKNSDGYSDYQVMAVDKNGLQSFLSEPVSVVYKDGILTMKADGKYASAQNKYSGYTGNGYILLDKNKYPEQQVKFDVDIINSGKYSIDFRYANGNGPINTDNKCAIRTLLIDGQTAGAIVLPQRGDDNWTDWGYTNSILKSLKKGKHTFTLVFKPSDNNMNYEINTALLDSIRLIELN